MQHHPGRGGSGISKNTGRACCRIRAPESWHWAKCLIGLLFRNVPSTCSVLIILLSWLPELLPPFLRPVLDLCHLPRGFPVGSGHACPQTSPTVAGFRGNWHKWPSGHQIPGPGGTVQSPCLLAVGRHRRPTAPPCHAAPDAPLLLHKAVETSKWGHHCLRNDGAGRPPRGNQPCKALQVQRQAQGPGVSGS